MRLRAGKCHNRFSTISGRPVTRVHLPRLGPLLPLFALPIVALVAVLQTQAATWYVDASHHDGEGDGTTWETALKTISAAVNAASAGDTVLVTNGIYNFGASDNRNRVIIDKAINVVSTRGPTATIIEGTGADTYGTQYPLRCVMMIAGVLDGFTLRGGATYSQYQTGWDYSGGGVYFAGAAELRNCVITNCRAYKGGASCGGTLINCTISGNTADPGWGSGPFQSTLHNSIVWGDSYLSCTFSYSCASPLPPGTANTASNPLFVAAGDFRLLPGSPCINSGNNAYVTGTKDILGNPRIQQGTVDMGAYERNTVGFSISQSTMTFTGRCYTAISPQMLTVSNIGGGTLNYEIQSDQLWLSTSPRAGTLEPGQATQHVVMVATRGLAPRAYPGNLTVVAPSATNTPQRVPVTMGISFPAPSQVIGWGNDSPELLVPAGLTNAVTVAAGQNHSLALRADGRVVAWGNNDYGQTNVPPGLTNAVALAGGSWHSLALKANARITVWGDNSLGQTNVPAGLTNVVAVACGSAHSLALRADGKVMAWGSGSVQTNVPADLSNVVAIASYGGYSLALKADGRIQGWGTNMYGVLTIPADLTNAVAIAAGSWHSLALRADGRVRAWGNNDFGQTNVPPELTNAVAIASGGGYSLALRSDGTLVSWGSISGGVIVPPRLANVGAIAAGGNHALATGTTNVPMAFAASSSSAPESISSVSLVISLQYPLAVDATVDYAVVGGTASNGVDYDLSPGTVTIPAGSLATSIAFTVVDDTLVESNETIVIGLSNPSNSTLGAYSNYTYTILNNDYPPPTVDNDSGATAIAPNGATLRGRVVSTGEIESRMRIYWGASDGGTNPASWGHMADFGVRTEGAYSTNVTGLLAGMAYYYRTYGSNASGQVWADTTTNFATLPPAVGFAATSSSGPESSSPVVLILNLSHTAGVGVAVSYSAIGGTASNGVDYDLSPGTVTIPAGSLATSIAFTVVDDTLVESNETIVIGLSNPSNSTLGAYSNYTYTILNNDYPPPTVDNDSGATAIAPNGATLRGRVVSTGEIESRMRIYWGDSDGGTNPASWGHMADFGVRTEGIYSTNVTGLLAGMAYYYRTYGSNASGQVWADTTTNFTTLSPPVVNNDSGATAIAINGATLRGGFASTYGLDTRMRIYWGDSDGGTNPASWGHMADFGVRTEGTYSTNVTGLLGSMTYYYRTYASNVAAQVWAGSTTNFSTLLPSIGFATNSSSGPESNSPALLLLRLSYTAGVDVAVNYDAIGGTASNGADYTMAPGTVTLSAGSTSTSLPFAVIANTDINADRTVVVRLSGPLHAILGAYSNHTYTILNDDFALPAVDNNSGAKAIGSDGASLRAQLNAVGGLDTTVRIYWGDTDRATNSDLWSHMADLGIRTEGTHSTNVTGLLANKTYYYRSYASNAFGSVWADATTNFTTLMPLLAFGASSVTGFEASAQAVFPLRLSNASAVDITVRYAVIAGTASNAMDYSLPPGILTIQAGNTSTGITFTILDDDILEPDETIVVGLTDPYLAALSSTATCTYVLQDNDLRFVAVSDSADADMGPTGIVPEVVQAIASEHPTLVLFSGDLVSTSSVSAYQQWTNLMAPLYSAGIGVYPVRGNHDAGTTNWITAFRYLPTNGPAGEIGLTYSVAAGNALFIGLDEYVQSHRVNQTWLNAQLAANIRPHIFVFGHEPAFPSSTHIGGSLDVNPSNRNTFWNSLKSYGVRGYFCGHEHFYDHARVDDGDSVPANDIHQYVVATVGAGFYPDIGYTNTAPWTPIRVYHSGQTGYLVGEIRGSTVTLTWKIRVAPGIYRAADPAPRITTTTFPTGVLGVPYIALMDATNGAPPYMWTPASALPPTSAPNSFTNTGIAMGWKADDRTWSLRLPFAFPFYGQSYTQCWVDSNGKVRFDASPSDETPTTNEFSSSAAIAVLWGDLDTTPGDVYVGTNAVEVAIRWSGTYLGGSPVNAAVSLLSNGGIRLRYGPGNTQGGWIGISSGDGTNFTFSSRSQTGSMSNAQDIIFPATAGSLPAGLTLSSAGVLSGTPSLAGTNQLIVFLRDSAVGEMATNLTLAILAQGVAPDADGDGLPDWWEWLYSRSLTNIDPIADNDVDGLDNRTEYLRGTDPNNADSDADHMRDGDEIIAGTDPTNADSVLAITALALNGTSVNVGWKGGTSAWQYLQRRYDLSSTGTEWMTIFTNLPPTSQSTNILDPTATNPSVFYRIRALSP